jgi:REP element-mobilizing transposase RayT
MICTMSCGACFSITKNWRASVKMPPLPHLALSIPPGIAVSDCVGQCKGGSSRAVNEGFALGARFRWQEGYSVMSFGEKALSDVTQYIYRQKARHASQHLNA